jgi:type III restriction enzyme
VAKTGVPVSITETITIGEKTTTARGTRYLTLEDLTKQVDAGILHIVSEERDKQGNLRKIKLVSTKYVESDTALLNRVLGRDIGGKRNILVLNDEAHHAYRIRRPEPEEGEEDLFGEEEEIEEFFKEATVWVEGLDRINKNRGINFCLDLSATPYFLGRMGPDSNRIFPWVVSEFGLTDAIESGLTKIPQLAVRDTTGKEIPGYFNIWRWILPHLTTSERGGKKEAPKPEAILKWAHTPIVMLAGLWAELCQEGEGNKDDPRLRFLSSYAKIQRLQRSFTIGLLRIILLPEFPRRRSTGFVITEESTRFGSTLKLSTRLIRARPRVMNPAGCALPLIPSASWIGPGTDRVGRSILKVSKN